MSGEPNCPQCPKYVGKCPACHAPRPSLEALAVNAADFKAKRAKVRAAAIAAYQAQADAKGAAE